MKNKHVRRSLAALLVLAMLLCALPVLPAAAEEVNLALDATATATASNSESGTSYTPDNAIDGDTTSKASRWATDADSSKPERWLSVNLGAARTISRFKIFWEVANVTAYTIETSMNGSEWTPVVTKTEKPASTTMEYVLNEAVTAQYVRLKVTDYETAVAGASWFNVSIYEIEIYGSAAPVVTNEGNLTQYGATATASNSESGTNFTPDKAIDGKKAEDEATSRWATDNDNAGTTERTLTVNLGAERTISRFKIFWEKQNATEYYIEISDTGSDGSWTPVVTCNAAPSSTEMEYTLAAPETAQYVRLRVAKYGPAVEAWYNVAVYEFEIYGQVPESTEPVLVASGTNLARLDGVSGTASNVESGTEFTADKARDGNKTDKPSRWATNQNVSNPTITFNLGVMRKVQSVVIYWENNNPIQWHIQTSANGQTWNTQATFTEKLTPATAPIQTVNFEEAVNAQYVRVWIENYQGDWNNVSMYEMEVYQEESEVIITPAMVAQQLAETLTVEDDKVVMKGTVPEGFTATFSANYEQLVAADGAIYQPLVDTQAIISVMVTKESDGSTGSYDQTITIPGAHTANEGNEKPGVIPELAEWYSTAAQQGKTFSLTADSRIVAGNDLAEVAEELKQDILDLFGLEVPIVASGAQAGDIQLVLADAASCPGFDEETYTMAVTDTVVLTATDSIGVYWGTRSVLQALKLSGDMTIAQGSAKDYPEFSTRGFMLDVGRKPFSMEMLQQVVKNMAWYKLNDFHVHLSDNLIFMEDYGRVEEATWEAYAGYRLQYKDEGLTSKDYSYSNEEFKKFISDSRALGISITPEIDVPAHALAITRYIKDVLGRDDLVLHEMNEGHPWLDHVDISKQEGINIIKEIFQYYVEEGIFDENTVVHIGADEFYASHEAYRNFLIQMIDYVENDLNRQVRVWGSLSQMSNGENYPFTANNVQGAQMNIWNTGWANPKAMYDLGFDLINTVDGSLYMVPSGNGSKGGYGDFLNTQSLYNSWTPENFGGTWLPAGSEQVMGATYAIWQDNIDTRAAGISETDTFYRFMDALPYLSVKMWGEGAALDRTYDQVQTDVATLGTAPGTNPYHLVEKTADSDSYAKYTFDTTEDRSGNERDLTLRGATLEDGALNLTGGSSYAETGLTELGKGNSLAFRVYRDPDVTAREQILFEADAAYGETTIKAISVDENGTWKLGFARELYEYQFDCNLDSGKWIDVVISTAGNKTTLTVNGKSYDAVGSFLPDENASSQFKGKTEITHSTFDLPVARMGSKTNAFKGKLDNVVLYENDTAPALTQTVTFHSDGGTEVSAITVPYGTAVTKPTNPTNGNKVFGGWYVDAALTTAWDFRDPVTKDLTLYAKWTETGCQHEKLTHVEAKAATCTEPGNVEYWYCEGCKKYFSEEAAETAITQQQTVVNALGHSFTHYVSNNDATCTEDGTKTAKCDRCDVTDTVADVGSATGHVLEVRNKKEATWFTEGYTGDTYCKVCDTLLKKGEVIPRKGSGIIIPIDPGTPSYELPFVDVAEGEWYYESVYYAWDANLIDGTSATTFRPDHTLTVAQAIKLAAALHQLENEGRVTLGNGKTNWYDTYVAYAVKEGIIGSKYQSYTQAQMNAPAKRSEFVHILHGALDDYKAINAIGENAIPDVKTGDAYADEIYDFYRAGILTGSNAEGTFHPESSIKRSEVAAILIRMYDESMRLEKTL